MRNRTLPRPPKPVKGRSLFAGANSGGCGERATRGSPLGMTALRFAQSML